MQVFVTGASGWIGSAVVPELIGAGHQVLGLARSESSAAAVAASGAQVLRGDLDDLDALRGRAASSDGVIHLAFIHDFTKFEASMQADARAIDTMGAALEGSGKPLVFASGTPHCPGAWRPSATIPLPADPRPAGAQPPGRLWPWRHAASAPPRYGCPGRCTAKATAPASSPA